MNQEFEICCVCEDLTGKAGKGDGSRYCECGAGPFCEECFLIHIHRCTKGKVCCEDEGIEWKGGVA